VTSRSVREKKNPESHRASHRKDMSPLTQGLNYRSACDLKDVSESAAVTMFGREFQVVGAVQRIARPEKSVLWNGIDSSI